MSYVTVEEARRIARPRILCHRCLVASEKDRVVCRECVKDLDALAVKRLRKDMGGGGGRSSLPEARDATDVKGLASWWNRKGKRKGSGARA